MFNVILYFIIVMNFLIHLVYLFSIINLYLYSILSKFLNNRHIPLSHMMKKTIYLFVDMTLEFVSLFQIIYKKITINI